MDFNHKFPFHSVYKMASYGLSLYTQAYVQKYLDESDKPEIEKDKNDETKKKFAKKSEIELSPEIKVGIVTV